MDEIMVSAATGVMNSVLTKLSMLLGAEYRLHKGVKRDIAFLKDELSSMNALLEKLADTEVLDPQQKEWRNQVREMAYDIEDCIDVYMHRLSQDSGKSNTIKMFLHKTIKKVKMGACHDIAEQIKELKTRIVEASQRRDRYKIDVADNCVSANVVSVDPRLQALYAEACDLVGIDVPRDELIKLVTDGEQRLKVVSIVGTAGLGKTTLANQIYQNIDKQFDCRAFVSVSQKPDTRKVLRNILSQVSKNDCQPGDSEWLINALRNFLKDKRYFIVIDDIWSTQAWKIIKCALLENTCGSRILVTTRIATVAQSCCNLCHLVHELKPLSNADSQSLFFRRVFGSEDKCPLQLKEVSAEIIRKCGGLPLAIITMSSLMTNKSNAREEWQRVLSSLGSGLEKNSDVEEMRKILSLSYNDLPHNLRTCLLYLSIFPEDYAIWRDNIVSRWIAEGFVKVDGGRNVWEEGESYFNELINRSMIQPIGIKFDGQALACRVHDMILDLIISKAVEENFITFIADGSPILVSQNRIRRLSLDCRGQENVSTMSSMVTGHVRSLGVFGYSPHMPPISDFHALRVLDIESCDKLVNCDLRNIGKLILLRYLRIESHSIKDLPEEIGELQHLETLDLYMTEMRELPTSIVKLRRLKWLLANGVRLPDGLSSMQALEELSGVRVYNDNSVNSLQDLGSLIRLRNLRLSWHISGSHGDKARYADILASSLGKLVCSNLRYLHICSCFDSADIPLDSWSSPPFLLRELNTMACSLQGTPEWITSLSNLTQLCIKVNQVLTQQMLHILGELPTLMYLRLESESSHPREMLIVSNSRFKCLKVFSLSCRIMGLMFEAGAMPKLEELSFTTRACEVRSACGNPSFGIHCLSALRNLTVSIDCEGARVEDVEALEGTIRNAASLLPKYPTPEFHRCHEEEMMQDDPSREEGAHKEDDKKQHQV